MPGGDKRGPNGMGPMTGRGLGYCAGYDAPGFTSDAPPRGGSGYGRGSGFGFRGGMRSGRGFGYGRGRGFGRGWRHQNYPVQSFDADPNQDRAGTQPDLAQELAALKDQIKALEEKLAGSSSD